MYQQYRPTGDGSSAAEKQRIAFESFKLQESWVARLKMQGGLLALTVIISILIFYLFQTVGVWLIGRVLMMGGFSLLHFDTVNELFITVMYGTAFFLPYLLYAKLCGFRSADIPTDSPNPPILAASLGTCLGVSVAGVFLSMVVNAVFARFGLYPMDASLYFPRSPLALFLMFINMTALPALVEEITIRGIVLGSLRQYGDRFAIVISAVIFALLHRNMAQFPNALLIGLAIGYFVVKTNSIWTGVVIHFVNNLLVLLIAAVSTGVDEMFAFMLQCVAFFIFTLLAAGGLLYLVKIRRLDMELFPSPCPVPERMLYRRFLLNFPIIMMLLMFAWVIYLNFNHFEV